MRRSKRCKGRARPKKKTGPTPTPVMHTAALPTPMDKLAVRLPATKPPHIPTRRGERVRTVSTNKSDSEDCGIVEKRVTKNSVSGAGGNDLKKLAEVTCDVTPRFEALKKRSKGRRMEILELMSQQMEILNKQVQILKEEVADEANFFKEIDGTKKQELRGTGRRRQESAGNDLKNLKRLRKDLKTAFTVRKKQAEQSFSSDSSSDSESESDEPDEVPPLKKIKSESTEGQPPAPAVAATSKASRKSKVAGKPPPAAVESSSTSSQKSNVVVKNSSKKSMEKVEEWLQKNENDDKVNESCTFPSPSFHRSVIKQEKLSSDDEQIYFYEEDDEDCDSYFGDGFNNEEEEDDPSLDVY